MEGGRERARDYIHHVTANNKYITLVWRRGSALNIGNR